MSKRKRKKRSWWDLSGVFDIGGGGSTDNPKRGSLLESILRRDRDPKLPDLGAFGGKPDRSIDLAADLFKKTGRSIQATADISGAGNPRDGGIGAGPAVTSGRKGPPDLKAAGGRSVANTPDVSGMDRRHRRTRGADLATGRQRGDIPDMSGAGGRRGLRSGPAERSRGWGESVLAFFGVRPMSAQEERQFEEFYLKAEQAGHHPTSRQIIEWRADIVAGRMHVRDLWNTEIGQSIEAKWGPRGARLEAKEEPS